MNEQPPLDSSTRRFPEWLLPAAVAGCLQLALMAAYAARYEGDPSAFVCAGWERSRDWPLEEVRVRTSQAGFDGQFYYVIARAPWARQDARDIDLPGYRHQRVLYPALAWLLSGWGDPTALLWVMPAINVLCIAGMAGLGACFATHFGRSRWWGVAVPLLVSAVAPALRNLTDPLAAMALLGLLVGWLLRWNPWALFLFGLAAVFSRETNIAVVGVVALAALAKREWTRAAVLASVGLVWAGWLACLWVSYGESLFAFGNFGTPFGGMLARLAQLRGDGGSGRLPIHAVGLAYVLLLVVIAIVLPLARASRVVTLTALFGAALAVCASFAVYMDGHSYTRVFTFLPLGILLWGIQSGRIWPQVALSPATLWPAYAVLQVWMR